MPELEDLIMSQQVSDSPEETPEDRMRAALMQRLGIAPEVRAKQMSDQVLGQGGQGLSGLMNRIFGGAHEGLRVANDPKYRGAYQEALGAAMEQEKNLMPYARQLEMSGAMRDKAKMDAREKERATLARVLDSTLKDARAKAKNAMEQQDIDQQGKESAAKIEVFLSQGELNKARAEAINFDRKLKERYGKVTPDIANAAAQAGVNVLDMTGEQAGQGMAKASQYKALGPAMVAAIRTLGGGGNKGGTRESTSWKKTGETPDGKGIFETFTNTSRFGGGGGSPNVSGMDQILRNMGYSGESLNGASGNQPAAMPSAQPPTPETRGAAALGVKPKPPVKSIPAMGSVPPAPTVRIGQGFSSRAAAKENEAAMKTIGLTQDIRHNLGTKVADLADSMDAIKGNAFTLRMMKYGQAIKMVPEFKDAYQQMMADMMQNRVIERLAMTGKQTNMTEMGEISTYMPSIDDTFPQAISKSIRLEVLSKLAQKRKEENWISVEQQFAPGRVTKIHNKILSLYNRAYEQKDPKERREMLKKIDKITDSKILWKLATDPKADFLLEVK